MWITSPVLRPYEASVRSGSSCLPLKMILHSGAPSFSFSCSTVSLPRTFVACTDPWSVRTESSISSSSEADFGAAEAAVALEAAVLAGGSELGACIPSWPGSVNDAGSMAPGVALGGGLLLAAGPPPLLIGGGGGIAAASPPADGSGTGFDDPSCPTNSYSTTTSN